MLAARDDRDGSNHRPRGFRCQPIVSRSDGSTQRRPSKRGGDIAKPSKNVNWCEPIRCPSNVSRLAKSAPQLPQTFTWHQARNRRLAGSAKAVLGLAAVQALVAEIREWRACERRDGRNALHGRVVRDDGRPGHAEETSDLVESSASAGMRGPGFSALRAWPDEPRAPPRGTHPPRSARRAGRLLHATLPSRGCCWGLRAHYQPNLKMSADRHRHADHLGLDRPS
jgi:hypothetical protein